MLHRSRNNPRSWRCSCIFGGRFLTVPTVTVSDGYSSGNWIGSATKNQFETFFFIFFHILPIAKWFGSQVSATVVQFLEWSSFCKLFWKSFGILRIKIITRRFGRLVQWFQLVPFTISFSNRIGTHLAWVRIPLALWYNLFGLNLFHFVHFYVKSFKSQCFMFKVDLDHLGNIYLTSESMFNGLKEVWRWFCWHHDVFDIFADWPVCSSFRMCDWKLPPHFYSMLLITLTYTGRGESIVLVCVVVCSLVYVVSVNVCCVCVILSCVLIHTLTHGVLTHICCKMTVQSIFMTLHFDTFLTLCCCTTQIPVWLRDKYCPFKIHSVWLLCVDSSFKYKSSDLCVGVSHFMVVLLLSLTSAVPAYIPTRYYGAYIVWL
jgi:hypothetical protein